MPFFVFPKHLIFIYTINIYFYESQRFYHNTSPIKALVNKPTIPNLSFGLQFLPIPNKQEMSQFTLKISENSQQNRDCVMALDSQSEFVNMTLKARKWRIKSILCCNTSIQQAAPLNDAKFAWSFRLHPNVPLLPDNHPGCCLRHLCPFFQFLSLYCCTFWDQGTGG